MSRIKTFGVVGAGQMGIGIAYVAALHGKLPVTLLDSNASQLNKQVKFFNSLLDKAVSKGKLDKEKSELTKSLLKTTERIEDFKGCDFVVEAVPEVLSLKQNLLKQLDQVLEKEAIIGTNTSSISITKLAASTKRPEKVIGMHFMNPVPVMKLVELIAGLETSSSTIQRTKELATSFQKITTVSQDVPGFIANRLLMPYINEAIYALQEGIASKEDIDLTMTLGTNVPMGPLTLADFIGLDTCLCIMKVLHEQLGDSKYRPSPLLVKYVDSGRLGKKVGRGIYEYPSK